MRMIVAFLASLLLASSASAQLPTGNNVKDAWYQGSFGGIRLFYGYSSDTAGDGVTDFGCRIDYYHDGRIRLLVSEGYYDNREAPYSSTTIFYSLKPARGRQQSGNELERISYGYRVGPKIVVEPVLYKEDPFTNRCVPHLDALFEEIPAPEVKMFMEQYGRVFRIE